MLVTVLAISALVSPVRALTAQAEEATDTTTDTTTDTSAATTSAYTLGIDVSKYNGTIDWESVAANSNIKFVIAKAGSTNSGLDPTFDANMKGAAAVGLSTGAYIYSYAMSVEEATEEANLIVSWLSGYTVNYPVVFDIENSSQTALDAATVTAMCNAFGDVVSAAGYTPLIYTYKNFYMAHITTDLRYGLWIAQYSTQCDVGSANIWQYTSSGSVSGISTRVDVNALMTESSFNSVIKTANGWYSDENGTRYRQADGTDAYGVCMVDGMDYYFDDQGYLIEGRAYKINGKLYVFDEYGEMQINCYYTLNGVTYYCDVRGIATVQPSTDDETTTSDETTDTTTTDDAPDAAK